MDDKRGNFRILEVNGGKVTAVADGWQFGLNPTTSGYADAQIDDYGTREIGRRHGRFEWRPGTKMELRAKFSTEPVGTAGFGFWNAPMADPTMRRLVLPQAVWFFYGAAPNHLPFAPPNTGHGWFVATLDAGTWTAVSLIPLAPFILLANQIPSVRRRLWPGIQRRLGISAVSIPAKPTEWHSYTLDWQPEGCTFEADNKLILATPKSPRGPLGFVCWLDNQYLVATANGRFQWGTLPIKQAHHLEIARLKISGD